MILIHADSIGSLGDVTEFLHDWWLDLSSVEFERNAQRVLFTAVSEEEYESSERNDAKTRRRVTVSNASALEITDTEKVGYYQINRFLFDADRSSIKLVTTIPLGFEVTVAKVDVEVEEGG